MLDRDVARVRSACLASLLTATILVSGCTAPENVPEPIGAKSPPSELDISFAQAMADHHRQTILMTQHAATNASPAVRQVADRIRRARQSELDVLIAWLGEQGRPAVVSEMTGQDILEEMIDAEDMGRLENAYGSSFDVLFVELMLRHHRGAQRMVEFEQSQGSETSMKQHAKRISDNLQAEVSALDSLAVS